MKRASDKMEMRSISMKHYEEIHITLKNVSADGKFFQKTLLQLEKDGVLINKIVFFGNLEKIKGLLPLARGRFPFGVVGDSLPRESVGKNVNLYISGIRILNGESQKVEIDGEILGNYFNFPDAEYLNISGIYLKNKRADFEKEAVEEYAKIEKILTRYGFDPKDIYRFWNYMTRIAKNYARFNEVRNKYFEKNGIEKFPAATGIEANLGFGKKINLGFEAMKLKKNGKSNWRTVSSDMQCEAPKYDCQVSGMPQGPKFSRAVLLDFPRSKVKKLFISGTSSVSRGGESALKSNLSENVAYAMASFEHLLLKNAFSLTDVVSSVVYFKNEEAFLEFEKLYVSRGWEFPYNPVFTNICRKDLFFEIEGVAVARK